MPHGGRVWEEVLEELMPQLKEQIYGREMLSRYKELMLASVFGYCLLAPCPGPCQADVDDKSSNSLLTLTHIFY
jgi:hypothetical protein